MWEDEPDDRSNRHVAQTIALALAAALVAGYRLARCATWQSVVDGP